MLAVSLSVEEMGAESLEDGCGTGILSWVIR